MKGKRNAMSVTTKERGETVIVLACVSATGVFLPPFVIFKGKNMKQEFRDNLPPGSVVFMSDSGYITIELFREFLEHFITHKPQGKKTNLLVLDGHSTHVSDPDILQFAVDNNIIMISTPPHTLHYIQPLGRSFLRFLKIYYYGACNSWIKQNPTRRITRLHGFGACGLVPFNQGAIPESVFSPSECFQMTETEAPAERSHCSFQPTNSEPVPGTSGLSGCGVSRQTKKRLSFSSSDSSPDDLFREDLHSKKDIHSSLQQLYPTPRILQKKSSSRCQKAAILTSPEHIMKMKEKKDMNTAKPKEVKFKKSAKNTCLKKATGIKKKKVQKLHACIVMGSLVITVMVKCGCVVQDVRVGVMSSVQKQQTLPNLCVGTV
ncbi:hypothetical protein PR048_014427 [Dryococelus australis]|uniref:DDE-1 domain-containing protein n=1 Tax=Dryococelus australis TaxID=614101 RepID=A0ABQ9HE66_9NEOP|nr:hypothetical protein PR048_014427 [Dryococelus australis]